MPINGRLPAKALYLVQGTMRANQPTAHDWKRMRAAAKKAGVTLTIAAPAGAYRSTLTQSLMHRFPARFHVRNPHIMAPVGSSSHGFGDNLDVYATGKDAYGWLERHMGEYGFRHRDRAGDYNCLTHS